MATPMLPTMLLLAVTLLLATSLHAQEDLKAENLRSIQVEDSSTSWFSSSGPLDAPSQVFKSRRLASTDYVAPELPERYHGNCIKQEDCKHITGSVCESGQCGC